jgi:signal transduction histidine kinase
MSDRRPVKPGLPHVRASTSAGAASSIQRRDAAVFLHPRSLIAPMDFFGLQDQLDALPLAVSGVAGDPEADVVRAWYLRQRDTGRALAECARAEAGLADLSALQSQRVAARIALVRAEATWLLGDNERGLALLTGAREIFTALADCVGVGDACLCEASLLDQSGGDSTAAIRAAAAAYARSDDGLRVAVADTWLACIESAASPDTAALRWNATLERARSLGHPGLDTFIEGALASQAYQRGDLAGTVEHFERSFDAALLVGQMFSAITVAQNLGIAFSALGDDAGALLWIQRARELVEPTGWPYASNWCRVQSASVLAGMGRMDAAHEMLSQGLPMLERFRESRNYTLATQVLAEVALARGEPALALAWCDRSLPVAVRLGFPDLASGGLRFKALALSKLHRPGDAMAAAHEGLAIAREQGHLRHESTVRHAMATIARDHALPPLPDSAEPSAPLHHLRAAFEAQRRSGASVPAEWLVEMSGDLQAVGELAGALDCQRQATAALVQAQSDKASSMATALQVRHRTESARADAAHQRALAQASQQRLDLVQASHATLEQLAEIGQSITRGLDADAIHAALARHVGTLLEAGTIAVWRTAAASPGRFVLAWGLEDGAALPRAELDLDDPEALTARCLRERRELSIDADESALPAQTVPRTAERRSALFVPLIAGDEVLGVLSIQSARAHAYGERERQVVRSLAASTAVALANTAQAGRLAEVERELEHQRMQGLLVHAGKMVAVGRLASGLVHEMSHPVGTLLLLAESMAEALARRRDAAAPDALELLREAERLAQIVRRLRNFARADSLQSALHNLPAVLADARALYGPRLAMEGIACDESVPALSVWADTERLSLAIANLVFNAADAMEGRDVKRLWISARQRGAFVALSVRDNGPGLSEAVAARLFEPFFTTKPEGKGLGLGLAVSAESLAGMHGRITAANVPGGGAEFTIELALDIPATSIHNP